MSGVSHDQEHGTFKSYVTGFVLSLIFTFIPYYLVVNKVLTGTTLLVTILGFAVVQLIIQVTFFLHLGRGPKPNWNLYFFAGTIVIILMVAAGSVVIINNLHYNMSPADQTKKLVNNEGIYQVGGEKTGACRQIGVNHKIVIKNGQATPSRITAAKCDTISFINQDEAVVEIVFGSHPVDRNYAGETELAVRKGRNKTINLSETGTYQFHDHSQLGIAGYFTVY